MSEEKLTTRFNLRVEASLGDAAQRLAKARRAKDLSDYLRGLLIMDALNEGYSLRGVDIPGWLTEKHIDVLPKSQIDRDVEREQKLLSDPKHRKKSG